jgi:fibronectin type 3 domain-containing protein
MRIGGRVPEVVMNPSVRPTTKKAYGKFMVFCFMTIGFLLFSSCPNPEVEDPVSNTPGIPNGFAVQEKGTDFIRLRWDYADNVVEYLVYADISEDGVFSREVYRGPLTQCIDEELNVETDYYYLIVAVNSFGSSPASSTLHAITDGYDPATPGSLSTVGTDGTSITISWTSVQYADSYRLLRDTSSSGTFSQIVYEGAALSFKDTTVAVNALYYYKLMAINTYGDSQSATPLAISVVPTAPASANAVTVGKSSISMSWTAPLSINTSRVYRVSPPGADPIQVFTGAGSSFSDSDLLSGTTYEYQIRYVNIAGMESAPTTFQSTTQMLFIRDVRDPASQYRPEIGDNISVTDMYVTGILTNGVTISGFFAQENSNDAYSGIGVFMGSSTIVLSIGDRISVTGEYSTYNGLEQITNPTVTVLESPGVLPFAPVSISDPSTITAAGANCLNYQSMLLSISTVAVTVATANIGGSVDGFTVTGGLIVCDRLCDLDPYAIADTFTSITGILGTLNANYILQPRSVADIVE